MRDSPRSAAAGVRAKASYHHGDLREALIAAAYRLVNETGAERFSLADACRLAGVSTAAPYRHFKDREAILAEVTARGFAAMTADFRRAVARHGEGTVAGIIAMGQAYVAFADSQRGVFRLMFGHGAAGDGSAGDALPHVAAAGTGCFGYLIEQITQYCSAHGVDGDAGAVAVGLWTFVHGASALLIDGKYARVTPGLDVDAMIARATTLLLGRGD